MMFEQPLTTPLRVAWRYVAVIALAAALAACARPGPGVLVPAAQIASGARLVTVYVATTRARDPAAMNVYTSNRAPNLNFTEFTIAIPPRHTPGDIEWPSGLADPERHFITVRQTLLSSEEFAGKVSARAARKAGVFIHGYNVSFQESVFRLAQMASDADIDGIPILFAWPAGETLVGYVGDKEAATYSRDALCNC